jgi:hypothetical protein
MKKKTSELFEGPNSSLHRAYDNAIATTDTLTKKDIEMAMSVLNKNQGDRDRAATHYLVLPKEYKKYKSIVKEFVEMYRKKGIIVKVIYQYEVKHCEASIAV